MIKEGLQEASHVGCTVGRFKRRLGDELLEGLLSKEYVEIRQGYVELTLKGTRALLDFEGYDWRTGKRRG